MHLLLRSRPGRCTDGACSSAASSSSGSFGNGAVIDVDATAVEEKRLQSNPRGKKKGEKFRCAVNTFCTAVPHVWFKKILPRRVHQQHADIISMLAVLPIRCHRSLEILIEARSEGTCAIDGVTFLN